MSYKNLAVFESLLTVISSAVAVVHGFYTLVSLVPRFRNRPLVLFGYDEVLWTLLKINNTFLLLDPTKQSFLIYYLINKVIITIFLLYLHFSLLNTNCNQLCV